MGAVNIFLGGTGKEIAEDIQDSKDFYRRRISSPIAFDLDTSRDPGVDMKAFVGGDSKLEADALERADQWAELNPGLQLGPSSGNSARPGPRLTPEHSVLSRVGKGMRANPAPNDGLFALRAHGLAIFSLLFDEEKASAGTGPGTELKNHIQAAIDEQTVDNELPRINLIASTAGGTGAGMFLPFALWLKSEFPLIELTLIAVTPSAFASVLQGDQNKTELAQKGKSGTYAVFRELALLQGPDPGARFSTRYLPVGTPPLPYRPGGKPFTHVYWFGGRSGQRPSDAFQEAGLLVRILNDDDAQNDLAGKLNDNPLQSVGSLTSIEYPKLRLQRRLVFSVLRGIYEQLRQPKSLPSGAAPVEASTHLLNYVNGSTDRPLGSWLFEWRDGPFADVVPFSGAPAMALEDRIIGSVLAPPADGWEAIPVGAKLTPLAPDGWASDASKWQLYVRVLSERLEQTAAHNQSRLTHAIREYRRDEEEAFARWLLHEVFDVRLSGDSAGEVTSTRDMLSILDRLQSEAESHDARVRPDGIFAIPTPENLQTQIQVQLEKVGKPEQPPVKTRFWQWLLSAAAGAAVSVGVYELLFRAASGPLPLWAFTIASVGAFAAFVFGTWLMRWVLLRKARKESEIPFLRKRAEERLFQLYRLQDRVRAVSWMHDELRATSASRRSFFDTLRECIREVRSQVQQLDDLYDALVQEATIRITDAASTPKHVSAEIGVLLEQDPRLVLTIGPEVRRRLRVEAILGANHQVARLQLTFAHSEPDDRAHFEAATAQVADLLMALRKDKTSGHEERATGLYRVQHAPWQIVHWRLGDDLPNDFADALLYDADGNESAALAALAGHLSMIGKRLPRPPSLQLPGGAGVSERRMYAGSSEILSKVKDALDVPGAISGGERSALAPYLANQRAVEALGEQAVFMDIWRLDLGRDWAPDVPSSSIDGDQAISTYYGALAGLRPGTTAQDNCFTILPELLAATDLELGGEPKPLHLAVAARLLGCDIGSSGPSYAELFYLLRSRGLIKEESNEPAGQDARRVTKISIAEAEIPILVTPVTGLRDDLFGEGRLRVAQFDAFVDFMRFDGRPVFGDEHRTTKTPEGDVPIGTWAADNHHTAELQRGIIQLWYQGDVEAEAGAMAGEAAEDARRMPSNVGADWERAMRRLVSSPERRATRRRNQ